jgi:hypothetical protein
MPNKSLRLISKEFNFPKKIHFVTINEIRAKKKRKNQQNKTNEHFIIYLLKHLSYKYVITRVLQCYFGDIISWKTLI